uniref:Uncharacterized protein n=1 Tax=Arundo donax TaxID=35708 RepID=A0A0A9H805_ARUDO
MVDLMPRDKQPELDLSLERFYRALQVVDEVNKWTMVRTIGWETQWMKSCTPATDERTDCWKIWVMKASTHVAEEN